MAWEKRLYFPSEERCAEDFFALKNPTASAGFEPANWVPKASTLPLDHRTRYCNYYSCITSTLRNSYYLITIIYCYVFRHNIVNSRRCQALKTIYFIQGIEII